MIDIPSAQHLTTPQQAVTQGNQEHDCVNHLQHNTAAGLYHLNNRQQFPSRLQDSLPTEPHLYPAKIDEYKNYIQPVLSTSEPQSLSYFPNKSTIPVAFQQNIPTSESSCSLPMNNLTNLYQDECDINISSTPHFVSDNSRFGQNTDNYHTNLNPFVDPSQNLTQPDQLFFVAQPILPANDGLDVGFLPDFTQHNNSNKTSDLKTVYDNSVVTEDLSLQPVGDKSLPTLVWKSQHTDNTCLENDDDVLVDMNEKIFSRSYTDTVTSITSTQFLIESPDQGGNETNKGEIKEIYFNCGYDDLQNQINKTEEMDLIQNDINKKDLNSIQISRGESGKEFEMQEKVVDSVNPYQYIEEFFHQHIIPVADKDIFSLHIQEITPVTDANFSISSYAKSANNLTVADESVLFLSQPSLSDQDTEKQSKRAVTMENLYDRSSFFNLTDITKMSQVCQKALVYLKGDLPCGSLVSLNNMIAPNCSIPAQEISLIDGNRSIDIISSKKHRRNVITLSITITLLFIAMGSVRNLQSSLNQEGGVGIISIALSYVGYMLGSIFSSYIVQNFQPRRCIVIGLIPNLIYVAANMYPAVWLMAIVSLMQGISLAIIWNAMSTYITFLSRGRALKKGEDLERVSSNFFGIFCLIYQSYHIIGNLVASLVLMPGSSTTAPTFVDTALNNFTIGSTDKNSQEYIEFESSALAPLMFEFDYVIKISQNESLVGGSELNMCGSKFCNHFEIGGSGVAISDNTKFMLFGIYMGCIVVAIVIAVFILEPLNHRLFQSTASPKQKMKLHLMSLAKFALDTRFLLLLPMLMYSIMQFGFISGEVTMAFVTCSLGIHMVGYTMICFGVTASLCSYISGIICKYTGRMPQIVTAAALNLAVLVFMTQWKPTSESLIPYFSTMAIWGASDGVWNCQVNSLMGVVFADKYEEAYAGLRIAQGLGVAILFSYSNLICMTAKIYIISAVCILALACYLIMEGVLKYRAKLIPVKQTSV